MNSRLESWSWGLSGDCGTFTYTLAFSKSLAPALAAYRVVGRAVQGRTVTLFINGRSFYGRSAVASHAGTVSKVVRDNGRLLTVRTSVRAGSRNGVFAYRVVLTDGEWCRVRYSQIA